MAAKSLDLFTNRLSLQHNTTSTSSGSTVHSYTSDLGPSTPVLTLIHGYPQSAYEYRYLVPILKDKVSLFIPELPGYGISTPISAKVHSKKAVGSALLEALESILGKRKVILGGHDRGARICHRLAVDKADFPNLDFLGVFMMDIVPTLMQWKAFSNPAVATGYFHWPLLANAEMATEILTAYGGGKWARSANIRIGGPSQKGKDRIAADGAIDVYGDLFDSREVIYYTSLDYEAGGAPEAREQEEDQAAGRKIELPTTVMFSKSRLGATQDVAKIWTDWVAEGQFYEGIAASEGLGHYLPEEAYEEVADALKSFIDRVTR
jgi:pimeloyl-ACP methyl ester carboxylesterase